MNETKGNKGLAKGKEIFLYLQTSWHKNRHFKKESRAGRVGGDVEGVVSPTPTPSRQYFENLIYFSIKPKPKT